MKKYIALLFALFMFNVHSQSITSEDNTSWYKSQLTIGLDQSGPTCIAMIIERNGPATTIQQVKEQINFINYDNLLSVLNQYDIYYEWLLGLSKWNGLGIVMIQINPSLIPEVPYEYSGSQYVLIVGETEDYYIINDPMVGSPIRYYSKEALQNARWGYIIWIP